MWVGVGGCASAYDDGAGAGLPLCAYVCVVVWFVGGGMMTVLAKVCLGCVRVCVMCGCVDGVCVGGVRVCVCVCVCVRACVRVCVRQERGVAVIRVNVAPHYEPRGWLQRLAPGAPEVLHTQRERERERERD